MALLPSPRGISGHLTHHDQIHPKLNGAWVDVKADFGAAGDDSTDDYGAIVSADLAAAAQGGGVVFFPPGKYRHTQQLMPSKNVHWLSLGPTPRWPYSTDLGPVAYLKPKAPYTGTACIRFMDKTEGSFTSEQGNTSITGLCLDGSAVGGTIIGIQATGLVKAIRLDRVTVRLFGGAGIATAVYNRAGVDGWPRGWEFDRVVANACGDNGFSLSGMTDAWLDRCLSVGNTGSGFDLNGPGQTKLTNCYAPFNGIKGFRVVGVTGGDVQFTACSSDRSQEDGYYVGTVTGPGGVNPAGGAITFTGCTANRDGKNSNSGGGNFAGFAVNTPGVPVIYTACTVHPGVEDNGTGTQSPQYAIRVTHAAGTNPKVHINGGYWWGATGTLLDGGNARVRIDSTAEFATGAATSSPTVDNTAGGFFSGRT